MGTEELVEGCMPRGKDLERYRMGKEEKLQNEIVGNETYRSVSFGGVSSQRAALGLTLIYVTL